MRFSLIILVLSILSIGCAAQMPTKNVVLPSGEHVVIWDTHGDRFIDVSGAKRHIYYVGYDTEHDFRDKETLKKEALRVWGLYKPQIISEDYDTCVVTPTRTDLGGGKEGSPFYFTRAANGQWLLQP